MRVYLSEVLGRQLCSLARWVFRYITFITLFAPPGEFNDRGAELNQGAYVDGLSFWVVVVFKDVFRLVGDKEGNIEVHDTRCVLYIYVAACVICICKDVISKC